MHYATNFFLPPAMPPRRRFSQERRLRLWLRQSRPRRRGRRRKRPPSHPRARGGRHPRRRRGNPGGSFGGPSGVSRHLLRCRGFLLLRSLRVFSSSSEKYSSFAEKIYETNFLLQLGNDFLGRRTFSLASMMSVLESDVPSNICKRFHIAEKETEKQ